MPVGLNAFVQGMKGVAGFKNAGAYRAGGLFSSALKGGVKTLQGRYGAGAAGMAYGGLAGGAYGMMDSNTSVLGGAMSGAMMGGAMGRYGGAAARGIRRGMNPARGPRWPTSQLAMRGARAMGGRMKGDALLVSNKARNGFNGLKSRFR